MEQNNTQPSFTTEFFIAPSDDWLQTFDLCMTVCELVCFILLIQNGMFILKFVRITGTQEVCKWFIRDVAQIFAKAFFTLKMPSISATVSST
jgi:hypothetical protein